MTLYKVLAADGQPYHGGRGSWPLPNGKRPGRWLKTKGKLVPCENGLHVCRLKDLPNWLGPEIWRVEVGDEQVDHGDKLVVREARLLSKTPWDARTARLFACDCAERALVREREAGREPDERSWEAIRVARRYADGDATGEELAAARAAAGAAAGVAAGAAAGAAAWAAAWAAARAAAGAAERDWQTQRLHHYLEGDEA